MTDNKTKDQEEKGDVTLHGGKSVSMAQAEAEAAVGGPIEKKAVHKTKDKAVHADDAEDKDEGHERPSHKKEFVKGSAEQVTEEASAYSYAAPPMVPVHAVPIFATQEEAHDAAAEEAEAAGVTPSAVFHVSPEGGSGGADY